MLLMATTDGAGSSCEDRFGLHQQRRKCSVLLYLVSKSPEVFYKTVLEQI
jgi:hypothetical protein